MDRRVLVVGGLVFLGAIYLITKRQGASPALSKAQVRTIPDIEDLDPALYGFDRPRDFELVEIHGSVKPMTYHFLISTKVPPKEWPGEVHEISPTLKAILSAKYPAGQTVSAHLYYAPDTPSEGHEVLLYPQRVRFSGVTTDSIPALLERVQQNSLEGLPEGVTSSPITGTTIFICSHRSRDKRCGYCGPVLVAEFEHDIKIRRLRDSVKIFQVSHVGGHKYAGNVIIYGPTLLDWYAYVQPSDARELVNQAVVLENYVPRLWRGRIGVSKEENARLRDICRELNAGK